MQMIKHLLLLNEQASLYHNIPCYINNIDGKCHIMKLKISRTCLTGYSGFISHEWFLIAWGADTPACQPPGQKQFQETRYVLETYMPYGVAKCLKEDQYTGLWLTVLQKQNNFILLLKKLYQLLSLTDWSIYKAGLNLKI